MRFILPIILFPLIASASIFAFPPSASAHTYPDGTLIRLEGDFKIYTIFKNKRRWIKNIGVFNSYGYKWGAILVIPPVFIEDMPMNNLVREVGDIKVYAINDAGYKRHISSPEVFQSYGFKWEDITTVTKEEIANYEDSYLVREVGDPRVYYLEDGKKRWVDSIESFYVHGMNWDAIHVVNNTDAMTYAESERVSPTSTIKPPSGTIPATPARPAVPKEKPAEPAIPAQPATTTPPTATSTPPIVVPPPSATSTPPTATSTEPIAAPTPAPTPAPTIVPTPTPTPIPTSAATTTPNATSTSDVVPTFTVWSPGGGVQRWVVGKSYSINWSWTGTASTVRISLYASSSFQEILAAEVPNTGTWTWTIPSNQAGGSNYTIRVFNLAYPNNFGDSIVFTILAPATASGPPPIGYWRFDGNGNNEIAGSPNATTVANAVFKSSGGKYSGYAYVPSSTDSIKVPYNKMFDLPNSFTIEFWFRQRSDQGFAQDLVYKGTPINNYNFRVFRQLWNAYNFGPIITGYTAQNTGYWSQTSNPNQLAHNEWHHVVYTKNQTGSAYYLDSSLTHTLDTTVYTEYSGSAKTPMADVIIGDSAVDTDFDNLRIYDRALDHSEVLKNYLE